MPEINGLMTAAAMAERLAKPGGDYSVDYYRRDIRHKTQLGLLEPVRYHGRGRTAAALYDEAQLLAERLFTAMTIAGLSPMQMAAAKGLFRNIRPAPRGRYLPGLSFIAQRLRVGERWHFVMHITLDEELGYLGGFQREPDFSNPLVQGLQLVAMVFDCRELFKDLLGLEDDLSDIRPAEYEVWENASNDDE